MYVLVPLLFYAILGKFQNFLCKLLSLNFCVCNVILTNIFAFFWMPALVWCSGLMVSLKKPSNLGTCGCDSMWKQRDLANVNEVKDLEMKDLHYM